MHLIAITLFGLLFVVIFGAKAARNVLKVAGVLAGLFIGVVLMIISWNANRPPAPLALQPVHAAVKCIPRDNGDGLPEGLDAAIAGAPVCPVSATAAKKSEVQQCEEWRASLRPCGIPYRNATGIGTLPLTCRTPDVRDLPLARTFYAGFQGIHGMDDQQAIAWLIRLEKTFVEFKTSESGSDPVQPPPAACHNAS